MYRFKYLKKVTFHNTTIYLSAMLHFFKWENNLSPATLNLTF
jgi:hypothetical protein